MRAKAGDPGVVPSGFFVLRTPLLPFFELTAWGEGLEAASLADDPEALADALARDRAGLRQRLTRLAERPELREAIFLASPSLDAGLEAWREDPDSDRGRKAEGSLVAYMSRAAARPTPFGLFAGCTTGRLDGRTRLRIEGVERYRRHSRLEMEYLWSLADAIEREPALRGDLLLRPNSSVHDAGDRLYFAEGTQAGTGRSYHLVAVDKTPYLMETLARAQAGASLHELAAALVDGEVTQTEAEEYLGDLVDSQILVSDARPQLTGGPPAATLIATLARQASTAPLAERLRRVEDSLAVVDADGVGAPPERYREIATQLDELPARPQLSRLVQVDLAKPAAELTLGRTVAEEIRRGVAALHALSRARPPEALIRWREEFVRRYETREVPLLQALDEENGIGFERSASAAAEAGELLAGLPLSTAEEGSARWTGRDGLLLRKLADALAAGSREITIDAAEVAALAERDLPPLPEAFEVLATVEAASDEEVDRGRFRVLVQSASGPSGARLLGRFCHLDPALDEHVREHLRAEEAVHPDRVYAEIVHQPEGRIGNILIRPVLREYEIPYLGRSGAPADRQLQVSDLLVSVQGERIVLRSQRLGREVVPRLTTAHNHAWRSLGVYRFLCALQHQGVVAGLLWEWGPLESAPFLPRVVHGRAVLARARWNLGHDDLAAFREQDSARRFARVQELRADRGLPRHVALADADNELVVDLENVLSVDSLARQVKTRPAAMFVELLPGPDGLCVSGPEGRFTHQIVLPFVTSSPQPSPGRAAPPPAAVPRSFPPGSEWLYLKLFTGTATADRVLDAVAGAVSTSLQSGAADRWFFIRLGDPDWHLRVRVHGDPGRLLHETLPAIHAATAPLLEAGDVWRVQLDTYEREVERYGGERGIELAERIFHADSQVVVPIVRALRGDEGAQLRWRAALAGIDRLLDDFGMTLEDKLAVARHACDGYGREFRAGSGFQRELSKRFRRDRASLAPLVDDRADLPDGLRSIREAFGVRSEAIAPAAAELRRLDDAGQLSVSVPELAMSYAHMHVNRLLRSAQRVQEYVLYELLDRLYTAQAAQEARMVR